MAFGCRFEQTVEYIKVADDGGFGKSAAQEVCGPVFNNGVREVEVRQSVTGHEALKIRDGVTIFCR